MTFSLKEIVNRLDSPSLNALLPKGVYELISLGMNCNEDAFRERCIQRIFSAENLLLNQTSLNVILGNIKRKKIPEFLNELGIFDPSKDPREQLETWAKNIDEQKLRALFRVFGEKFPEYEETQMEERSNHGTVVPAYPLFPYQKNAILNVLDKWYRKRAPRVLLHMPTGSGKTRTAMNIVSRFLNDHENGLVIWLADTEELCLQAQNEFEKAWRTLGNSKVGFFSHFGANKYNLTGSETGFICSTLQSASKLIDKSPKVANLLNLKKPLVIFDEAHKATANTYEKVLDYFGSNIIDSGSTVLGLTATPGRASQDESEYLAKMFEQQIVTLNVPGYSSPIDFLMNQGYLARPTFKTVPFDFKIDEWKKMYGLPDSYTLNKSKDGKRIEDFLNADTDRTYKICEAAIDLAKRHKRIMIFAGSVEQSRKISCALNFFLGGGCSYSVDCTLPAKERQKIIEWYRAPGKNSDEVRILCNVSLLTTGFDAPETSAVLVGCHVNSLVLYSQMVGRALRGPNAGGSRDAEIVRIVDNGLPEFMDVSKAFSNWDSNWR